MPTTPSVSAAVTGSVSTTKLAKYLPAASLITVTVDGTEGRLRDHLTRTSPIFGRDRSPPVVITCGAGGLTGAERIVADHPRTPERPGQRRALRTVRIQAEAVPQQHTDHATKWGYS